MTKTIPNYLKVHHGPAEIPSLESDSTQDSVTSFWQAYTDATGWRIDSGDASASPRSKLTSVKPVVDASAEANQINRSSAERLAESAAALTEQLEEARDALRVQAAELSARAAIVNVESRGDLAGTITSVLKDAVAACECDAAAMYLLDDDTQFLAARSVHGLPMTRVSQPPRELRGCRADLEAMIQRVVAIEDLNSVAVDTWNCPESAGSAICAGIFQDDVPLGTLWLFSNQARSISSAHEHAARLATSHIATVLNRAAVPAKSGRVNRETDLDHLAQWQYAALPTGQVLAPGWRVDGMIESPKKWATGWHAWDVLPDGTMMVAIAQAEEASVAGAMTATVARAALTAHSGYRHTPKQMLQRISDTLWQTNTMEQLTSLLYARIDPETGEGEVATAGNVSTLIASRYGYRPVIERTIMPLAGHFDVETNLSTFRMMPDEVLLAHTKGMQGDGINQMTLGNLLRGAMQKSESCPLASIRRSLVDVELNHERGAVTILRQDHSF